MEEAELRILAVDPGENNGWCILDYGKERGIELVNTGTTRREAFYASLDRLLDGVNFLVVEDFAVKPDYAKKGAFDFDRMPACQVIGALDYISVTKGLPMVLQSPSIKPMGYGYLGWTYKRGAHDMHAKDAAAHGVYYFVSRLKATPPAAVKGEAIVKAKQTPLKPLGS